MVRLPFASFLHGLARIMGPNATVRDPLPIILEYLNDENEGLVCVSSGRCASPSHPLCTTFLHRWSEYNSARPLPHLSGVPERRRRGEEATAATPATVQVTFCY